MTYTLIEVLHSGTMGKYGTTRANEPYYAGKINHHFSLWEPINIGRRAMFESLDEDISSFVTSNVTDVENGRFFIRVYTENSIFILEKGLYCKHRVSDVTDRERAYLAQIL